MEVTIVLPWPPSVNHYWFTMRKGPMVGRTIVMSEGHKYRKAVQKEVERQKIPCNTLVGKLCVHAVAYPPNRIRRDLDNLWKSVLDCIGHAGVIVDDSEIDELAIKRGPVRPGGCIVVNIEEMHEELTATRELPLESVKPELAAQPF